MSSPSPYVGSVFRVAIPLIVSGLASNLTIYIDRILLSNYSVDMMSHVSTVSSYCWMILYLTGGITYVSKVFIGRYNGAREYDQCASVTWHMIYYSLSCTIVFALAYILSPYFIPEIAQQYGLAYFRIIMLGGIFWPLVGGLCSFFIGTLQSSVVFYSLIIANAVNIALDLLWIPVWGTIGAALATVLAMFSQTLFLFCVFLNHQNRIKYNTLHLKYDPGLLSQVVKIGYPESLANFFEMLAWSTVITIIAYKGRTFMLVSNLAQNLYILFMFVYLELGAAVRSMCSNYMGEDKASHIPRLIVSATIIHVTFIVFIASLTLSFPYLFINTFNLDGESIYTQALVVKSLKGVFFFMLLDGIAYIMSSVLSAYGDTFMNMVLLMTTMWLFLVLPTYLLIHYGNPTASSHSIFVLPLYGFATSFCYLMRYQRMLASGKQLATIKKNYQL